MKHFCIILFILIFPKFSFSQDLFVTDKYIIKFQAEEIDVEKNIKIDELKVKTFKLILKKNLNQFNYQKIIEFIDSKFVNKFILNMTINNEKIVNNNYYSEIKINYNKSLIIKYFIKNKYNFVINNPEKFLLIIYEEDNLQKKLLSKNNLFYDFLINNSNNEYYNFLIPNLDFNDRFIFSYDDINQKNFTKLLNLNKKYNVNSSILIDSKKNDNFYIIKAYFFHNNIKYKIFDKNITNINYDKLFFTINELAIDKWKSINEINSQIINQIDCKVTVNNIYELKFLRSKIKSNFLINKLDLKLIDPKANIYNIKYLGNIKALKKSFSIDRLHFSINDGNCIIKLL